jgi:hypothetical protein
VVFFGFFSAGHFGSSHQSFLIVASERRERQRGSRSTKKTPSGPPAVRKGTASASILVLVTVLAQYSVRDNGDEREHDRDRKDQSQPEQYRRCHRALILLFAPRAR